MEDMFGVNSSSTVFSTENEDLPTLPHVVDLMVIGPHQVASIYETERLAASRERVFEVARNVWMELDKLGSWNWSIFDHDKRLKEVFRQYQQTVFEKLGCKTNEEPVDFVLHNLSTPQKNIAQQYKEFFKNDDFYLGVNATESTVTFSAWGWALELSATVQRQGKHDVGQNFYNVLLSHMMESPEVIVSLRPMAYQINNSHVYPPTYEDPLTPEERYKSDLAGWLKFQSGAKEV